MIFRLAPGTFFYINGFCGQGALGAPVWPVFGDRLVVAVLEDHRDDPVVQEIAAAIFAMTEDEQIDLVTLAWLRRGDGSLQDWHELRAEAARRHNKRTVSYLLGMRLLADYLDEALAQFGHSCDE